MVGSPCAGVSSSPWLPRPVGWGPEAPQGQGQGQWCPKGAWVGRSRVAEAAQCRGEGDRDAVSQEGAVRPTIPAHGAGHPVLRQPLGLAQERGSAQGLVLRKPLLAFIGRLSVFHERISPLL